MNSLFLFVCHRQGRRFGGRRKWQSLIHLSCKGHNLTGHCRKCNAITVSTVLSYTTSPENLGDLVLSHILMSQGVKESSITGHELERRYHRALRVTYTYLSFESAPFSRPMCTQRSPPRQRPGSACQYGRPALSLPIGLGLCMRCKTGAR